MVARRLAVACIGIAASGAALAVACTTFDGLSVPDAFDGTAPPPPAPDGGDAAPRPDSGNADAGPDAPAPLAGYLSLADAAKACSRVFACPELPSSILQSIAVPVDALNYSACLDWFAGPIPPTRIGVAVQAQILSCIANATSCTKAGACVVLEQLAASDPRCTGPDAGAERCADDGGTVMRCKDGYALHCDNAFYAPGSKCLRGSDGTHWCSTETNCTVQDSCLGSLLDYCGGGSNLHESINCAVEGYTCGQSAADGGGIDCLSTNVNVSCGAVGFDCMGDAGVVGVCDGVEISEFECRAFDGGTCSKKGGGTARCARPGDACSPYDANAVGCNGTVLSACVGGAKVTLDCASIGLGCKAPSGSLTARCG